MSAIAFESSQVSTGKFVQQMFDWDTPSVAPAVVTASRPVANPPRQQAPAARRGRCEHVGSVMGAVLSKYGLSVDDLLHAIEQQQRELAN
jgi:hypothetical protein